MIVRPWRVPLLVGAMLSMAYGIWLGLLRLGWVLPLPRQDQLILHGPLMIGGFLGTLIGLERAIGVGNRWVYTAPVSSVVGALVLVFGPPGPAGPILITVASAVVSAVFVVILRRQPSMFVATLLAGSACWFIGNVDWLRGAAIYRVVFWWIGFVVLTIAGERLELNRLLRPTPASSAAFAGAIAILIAGFTGLDATPASASRVIGVGLVALAAWLMRNDIARRTIRQQGLTRYMAVCLMAGYVWLGLAGILLFATQATAPGPPHDAILHAIFVGFVVSMIFGHALIIFPAVLGVSIPYRSAFYVPLAILHTSVIMRVAGDLVDELGLYRSWGGLFNALALLLFIFVVAGSVFRRAASGGRKMGVTLETS